jgi:hypothetical protein
VLRKKPNISYFSVLYLGSRASDLKNYGGYNMI